MISSGPSRCTVENGILGAKAVGLGDEFEAAAVVAPATLRRPPRRAEPAPRGYSSTSAYCSALASSGRVEIWLTPSRNCSVKKFPTDIARLVYIYVERRSNPQ